MTDKFDPKGGPSILLQSGRKHYKAGWGRKAALLAAGKGTLAYDDFMAQLSKYLRVGSPCVVRAFAGSGRRAGKSRWLPIFVRALRDAGWSVTEVPIEGQSAQHRGAGEDVRNSCRLYHVDRPPVDPGVDVSMRIPREAQTQLALLRPRPVEPSDALRHQRGRGELFGAGVDRVGSGPLEDRTRAVDLRWSVERDSASPGHDGSGLDLGRAED